MSKKISVICAARHKINPGMESVDLGFYFFAKRFFPDAEVTFFKFCDDFNTDKNDCDDTVQQGRLPFEYRVLGGNHDELYKSDAIIFWGDFFHMAHYRKDESLRQVNLGNVATCANGLELVDRFFFLSDAPMEVLKKVVIFGGNLLFNHVGDYSLNPYAENLRRLLSHSAGVFMRDVFFSLTAGHVANDYDKTCLGTDCAMLLKSCDIEELRRNQVDGALSGKGSIGVFLHRNSTDISVQLKFIRKLAKVCGLNAQWLPWRHSRRIKAAKRWAFPGLEIPEYTVVPSVGDLFDMIRGYAFVVTDTYHICVNSWNLGVPAVCVGEMVSEREMDVSCGPVQAWRDKRWTFYSMFEALKYYVNAQELSCSGMAVKRIKQLAESLENKKDIAMISRFMRCQAESAEKRLVQTLEQVLRG